MVLAIDYEERVFEEYHLENGAYVRTTEAGAGDDFTRARCRARHSGR